MLSSGGTFCFALSWMAKKIVEFHFVNRLLVDSHSGLCVMLYEVGLGGIYSKIKALRGHLS